MPLRFRVFCPFRQRTGKSYKSLGESPSCRRSTAPGCLALTYVLIGSSTPLAFPPDPRPPSASLHQIQTPHSINKPKPTSALPLHTHQTRQTKPTNQTPNSPTQLTNLPTRPCPQPQPSGPTEAPQRTDPASRRTRPSRATVAAANRSGEEQTDFAARNHKWSVRRNGWSVKRRCICPPTDDAFSGKGAKAIERLLKPKSACFSSRFQAIFSRHLPPHLWFTLWLEVVDCFTPSPRCDAASIRSITSAQSIAARPCLGSSMQPWRLCSPPAWRPT